MKHYYLKALTLLSCLLFGITTHAHDFEAQNSDGVTIYYNIISSKNKTVSITYKGSSYTESVEYSGTLIIPEKVINNDKKYSITNIDWHAFKGCTGLTNITIPSSVTSIGTGAFEGCTGLTNITIPSSVTTIDISVFKSCTGLTNITIPNSVTKIGDYAFSGCSGLTSVTIPNSVTTIGNFVFEKCICLTSIEIPNSVTSIGCDAFRGCIELSSITTNNGITYIGPSAFYGTAWYENQLDGILYLNNYCLGYKKIKPTGNLTIKEGTLLIATWAFKDCIGLTSVSISNSVTSIGAGAFEGCTDLTNVTIPNSVTRICDNAFSYCANLESIIVKSGNAKYDSRNNCNAIIETSTNTLIEGCNNTIIPNSITTIGKSAFDGCSKLTYIKLPNSIHTIEENAFRDCIGLTSIEIPSSINCIKQGTFYGCTNLNSINIPNSVTSICNNAFYNTKWYNSQDNGILYLCNCCLGYKGNAPTGDLTIKEGTRIIADMSFYNCNELTSITIPSSITNFGYNSFGDTKGLTVNIDNLESWCNINFDFFNSNPLYLGKLNIKGIEVNDLTIPNNITEIKNNAFRGCISINTVKIPDTTKIIGSSAFVYCYNLEKIFIGNSIENIGSTSFQGCSKINEIVCFPKNPPVSEAWFPETVLQTATLYVPEESISLYQVANDWKYFSNIKGLSSSAIKEIVLNEENEVDVIEMARYDISGRLISAPTKGINFVKMSDGTMKKVIVK